MDAKARNDRGREFVSVVAGTLSAALSLAIGDSFSLEVSDIYDLQGKAAAQFRIGVSGNLSGECFIEFYDPLLTRLAARTREKSDIAAKDNGETLKAAVDSAMQALTDALAAQYGPVEFAVDAVSGLAFGETWMVPLAAAGDRSSSAVHVFLDGALLDSLSAAAAAGADSEDDAAPVHPANLKLVMDVELNVSLRFGQRQMPLREVLGLASGSVVELDRKVNEPVELLLDGKLVARGEAVIVDGNYGMRVTEIPQSIQSHFLN
jgi:flagellar motor switch protein FliN/FliY